MHRDFPLTSQPVNKEKVSFDHRCYQTQELVYKCGYILKKISFKRINASL